MLCYPAPPHTRPSETLRKERKVEMASFEVGGDWWLPGREDRKMPGILSFSPEKGGELRVIGGALLELEEVAPREPLEGGGFSITATEDAIDQANSYDRILGEAEGKCYTLERCLGVHRAGGFLRSYRQVIHVERIYVGIRFDEGEVAGGDGVLCEFRGLAEWVGRTGIGYKVETRESEPGHTRIEVHGERIGEQEVRIGQVGNLILRHHIGPREEPGLTGLAENFTFKLGYPEVLMDRNWIGRSLVRGCVGLVCGGMCAVGVSLVWSGLGCVWIFACRSRRSGRSLRMRSCWARTLS